MPVPASESLGMLGPDEAARAAAESVKAGVPGLKIRLGFPSLEEDVAAVRAARAVGGWLEAAAVARTAGRAVSGRLCIEAGAHLLAVTPTRPWLEHLDLAGPLLEQPVEVLGGRPRAGERPGLGLRWGPGAVAHDRIDA